MSYKEAAQLILALVAPPETSPSLLRASRARVADDPLPLTRGQLAALASIAGRELGWVLPVTRREARAWAGHAERIPDQPIRDDALKAFQTKRGHLAGATIFAALPRHREPAVLHALIAFQLIFDLLDDAHERHPTPGNRHLFAALADAVTPSRPIRDYYAEHPWSEDADYLRSLVQAARRHCEALPSFGMVEELLARDVERASFALATNHLEPAERDAELSRWAAAEYPHQDAWAWFELSAAASGQLNLFALLALAAKPGLTERELTATYDAYWPLLPLITTMLDSYVDQAEDGVNGDHRYVDHYGDENLAVERICELIEAAAAKMVRLPDGHRHAVILACMVSFYLCKESALAPAMKRQTKRLIASGGSLPRALSPVLRAWRMAYSQRDD